MTIEATQQAAEEVTFHEALHKAGIMAHYAIALVGGQGLNCRVPPCHPDHFSSAAKQLRLAAEDYNNCIVSLRRSLLK